LLGGAKRKDCLALAKAKGLTKKKSFLTSDDGGSRERCYLLRTRRFIKKRLSFPRLLGRVQFEKY
jgi:hypothetical protein